MTRIEPLKKHLYLVDERNADLITDRVLGINIDKYFMPSVANIIGTDLSKYKLIKKGLFACNPMHVGRDERLPVALFDDEAPALVSPAYFMFRIKDSSVLNEEYLMMWFRRPEFDHQCWIKTDGSVRGGITWDDICRLEIPVIPYQEQIKLVKQYQVVTDRIALKQKINDNLREIATFIFSKNIRYITSRNEPMVTTELGTFPASWSVVTLGDAVSKIIDHRGVTPLKLGSEWSNEGIIALSAKCVKKHELINLETANRVDNDLYERWMPDKLRPHDILMTSEAPLGEFYYIADYCKYCLSQRLFAIRANPAVIAPTVLYFQMSDAVGTQQIDIRKTGTTVTGIRQSELIKIPVIIPSKKIQSWFSKICEPIMLQIERNSEEIRKLSLVKNMILSCLSRR